jgi:hypothetical protein
VKKQILNIFHKKIEILFLLFVEVIANNTGFTMSYNPAKRAKADEPTERDLRASNRDLHYLGYILRDNLNRVQLSKIRAAEAFNAYIPFMKDTPNKQGVFDAMHAYFLAVARVDTPEGELDKAALHEANVAYEALHEAKVAYAALTNDAVPDAASQLLDLAFVVLTHDVEAKNIASGKFTDAKYAYLKAAGGE